MMRRSMTYQKQRKKKSIRNKLRETRFKETQGSKICIKEGSNALKSFDFDA